MNLLCKGFSPSIPLCFDEWDDCAAYVTAGYCNETHPNKPGILQNCKKSCGMCDYSCNDHAKDCPSQASKGHCNDLVNGAYMMQNCRESCNACDLCSGDSKSVYAVDDNEHAVNCPNWANTYKYCDDIYHTNFMMEHCRSSCNASCSNTTALER